MKRFRAALVAILLAISAIGIGVAQSITPASATLSVCSRYGQYAHGDQTHPYQTAGISCQSDIPSGGRVRLVITCKYVDFLINRTYTIYTPWAGAGALSWGSCGDHPDSYNIPDYTIHICPQMTQGYNGVIIPSYWGSNFCF